MSDNDLFSIAQNKPKKPASNVPEYSVSDLAKGLKKTLEDSFAHIRVRGELSGIKLAASGHLYGDIKDDDAVINIVCWRGNLSKIDLTPEDGMEVLITGRISSYPKSSRYQIVIETMELAGEGALLKLLEQRKRKLAAEGLFDPERKKRLPLIPRKIGIITSPTGAVIRDIMHRLRDRFPRPVILYPTIVQGDKAAAHIIQGIDTLHKLPAAQRPDVIIIARGGGSLEDLMPFNDESLVRAVAAARLPIISAIGHETDTTLIDYAADLRAPTPTGAAEMIVPVRLNLLAQIQDDGLRLTNTLMRSIREKKYQLDSHSAKIANPQRLLETKTQAVDFLHDKIINGWRRYKQNKTTQLERSAYRLRTPDTLIQQKQQQLAHITERLKRTAPSITKTKQERLNASMRMLESLSPKSVLSRGYALAFDAQQKLITDPDTIKAGDTLHLEFAQDQKIAVTAKNTKEV